MSMLEHTAEFLVRAWIQQYRRAPKSTVAVTVIGFVFGAVAVYIAEQTAQKQRETWLKNSTYAAQAQALDQTRANLQSLLEFVESERKQLEVSQRTLQDLKSEHDRLKPVIETDRKAIDALFAAQEARNQSALSSERWIGFGLGVFASLVASLVWAIGVYVWRRRSGGGPDGAA